MIRKINPKPNSNPYHKPNPKPKSNPDHKPNPDQNLILT